MAQEKLTLYDPAEDLTTPQAIADFMVGALETEDATFIEYALDVISRAQNTPLHGRSCKSF